MQLTQPHLQVQIQRKVSEFMQGGTPERRKRWNSAGQTLHISDPELT